MATQSTGGIQFAIEHEQQALRLLELPTELLDLLTGPDPPTLVIKSAPVPDPGAKSNGWTSRFSQDAVLCTPDSTYQLRQVQTSNSVFVIQPSISTTDDDSIPQAGVTAITQCSATLELRRSTESAKDYLMELLPTWTKGAPEVSRESLPEDKLFDDIPLSTTEIQREWTRLCAFETNIRQNRCSFRPASTELLGCWRAIIEASYAENIRIHETFDSEALWRLVEDEGYPRELFNAILQRLTGEEGIGYCDGDKHSVTLNSSVCTRWTAALLLENSTGMSEGNFTERWHSLLPAAWHEEARTEDITDLQSHLFSSTAAAKSVVASSAGGSSTNSTKSRKWHDKFRNSRK